MIVSKVDYHEILSFKLNNNPQKDGVIMYVSYIVTLNHLIWQSFYFYFYRISFDKVQIELSCNV